MLGTATWLRCRHVKALFALRNNRTLQKSTFKTDIKRAVPVVRNKKVSTFLFKVKM